MLELIGRFRRAFGPDGKTKVDDKVLASCRNELVDWAGRALDIHFLRATLGPIWSLLDSTATPSDPKPSAAIADADRQASHIGWLGDHGHGDLGGMLNMLTSGGQANAELVVWELSTADPETRSKYLTEIKHKGLLDALCSELGWAQVKQLHDGLANGYGDLKSALQKYFIGERKFGPALGEEWENHDSSFHSLVAKLGLLGKGLNFGLDVGTFGFHSSYGKALDDYSNGQTSPRERDNAKAHAALRTAAVALVSTMTGGLAGRVTRMSGGGAGAAGAAAGSIAATTGLATSDAYNTVVSKTQGGFSSPEEYVKAALLGGLLGGAFEKLTSGLGDEASQYVKDVAPQEKSGSTNNEGVAENAGSTTHGSISKQPQHVEGSHRGLVAMPIG